MAVPVQRPAALTRRGSAPPNLESQAAAPLGGADATAAAFASGAILSQSSRARSMSLNLGAHQAPESLSALPHGMELTASTVGEIATGALLGAPPQPAKTGFKAFITRLFTRTTPLTQKEQLQKLENQQSKLANKDADLRKAEDSLARATTIKDQLDGELAQKQRELTNLEGGTARLSPEMKAAVEAPLKAKMTAKEKEVNAQGRRVSDLRAKVDARKGSMVALQKQIHETLERPDDFDGSTILPGEAASNPTHPTIVSGMHGIIDDKKATLREEVAQEFETAKESRITARANVESLRLGISSLQGNLKAKVTERSELKKSIQKNTEVLSRARSEASLGEGILIDGKDPSQGRVDQLSEALSRKESRLSVLDAGIGDFRKHISTFSSDLSKQQDEIQELSIKMGSTGRIALEVRAEAAAARLQ